MESILLTIKKLLGDVNIYEPYDIDIITFINSAFIILRQLGVGPSDGFYITDETQTWSDFIEDSKKIDMVKTYIYLKSKLLFDPPSSSTILESTNKIISEIEWRLTNDV